MTSLISASATSSASSPDPITRNRDLVEHYFAAIATSDLEALESLLAPDLRMRCAGGKGTAGVVRIDSFEELAEDIRRNEGELYDPTIGIQPEILNLTAEADRVAAEVRIRGISAHTGAAYDNLYAFFFWIRDGVIAEIHEHLDTLYVGATLLEPAGISAGVEMPWLREAKER
ncbi:nuclear transport factor 2 family protein [Myxococcota bacterium]|nr:nuclear transport factor 2 family protein [Myxococcota bacterium]